MSDNRTTELLMREFVDVACECEVRDYLISEYAERIEQAIAATLGGGKLTAEQVCEAIEANSWPEQSMILEFSDSSWQAIADELNAALGGGECEWTLKEKWSNRTGDDHVYGYETSCGARHTWWPDSLPNFCPTCGGRVKAVKR